MPPPIAAHADDAYAGVGRRSAPSCPRRKHSRFAWLGLGCGAGMAAVVVLAPHPEPALLDAPESPAVHPAPVSAPVPVWEPITQPAAIYAVHAPGLQGLPFTYEPRRDGSNAREDSLAFGTGEADARPYFRLVAHRSAEVEAPGASFFVDLARRAADAGFAVDRSAPADALRTKFGVAEVADVVLAGSSERACIAFRLDHPEITWRLGGWLCGAEGRPAARRRLACMLDGVSLLASDDPALKTLFAQAERQRDEACAPPRVEAQKPAAGPRAARRRQP